MYILYFITLHYIRLNYIISLIINIHITLYHTTTTTGENPGTEISGHKISVDNTFVISKRDMRRRLAKSSSTKLQKYLRNETDSVEIKHSSSVTVTGCILVFFGFMSLLFSCVLGVWKEERPRFKKKI